MLQAGREPGGRRACGIFRRQQVFSMAGSCQATRRGVTEVKLGRKAVFSS